MPNAVTRVRPISEADPFHPKFEPVIEGFLPDAIKSESIAPPTMLGTAVKEAQPSKVLQDLWYQDSLASASIENSLKLTVKALPKTQSKDQDRYKDSMESLKNSANVVNLGATAANAAVVAPIIEEEEEQITKVDETSSFRRFLFGSMHEKEIQPNTVEDKSEANDPKAEMIGIRPRLITPPQVSAKNQARLDEEMASVTKSVKNLEDSLSNTSEKGEFKTGFEDILEAKKALLLKTLGNSSPNKNDPAQNKEEADQIANFLAALATQAELKKSGSTLQIEDVARRHKHNNELMKKYLTEMEELNNRSKATDVLKWVNVGITLAVVGIVALTIFTAGFGAILGIAAAIAGVVAGGFQITKGALDYQNNLQKGEIQFLGLEREENHEKIKSLLQDMSTSTKSAVHNHTMAKTTLDNMREAARFRS